MERFVSLGASGLPLIERLPGRDIEGEDLELFTAISGFFP